jgi:hypothetical protein
MPRLVPLAVFAALVPLPALAQDSAPGTDIESGLVQAAEAMRDPARQEQMAAMGHTMLGLLLEMPIGSLLQGAAEMAGEEPASIDPETTLRELAGPKADEAPRALAEATPRMMSAMGTLAGALARMAPEMRRIGRDIARELPDADE